MLNCTTNRLAPYLIIFSLLMIQFPFVALAGELDRGEVRSFMTQYFRYLKDGDLDGILSSVTDPIKSEKGALLRDNPAYASSLKKEYEHVKFVIVQIADIDGTTCLVDVREISKGPTTRMIQFHLKREAELFKISEERLQY